MIKYTVEVSTRGDKFWRLNGELHREDGPAIERAGGYKEWWLNGELHREDGPAVERAGGTKSWYLNGEPVTEEEVMNPVEEMTMDQICKALGKNVKVIK